MRQIKAKYLYVYQHQCWNKYQRNWRIKLACMTSTLWAKWGQWGISRRACDKGLYFSPLSSHAHNAPLPCLTHKAQGGHFRFQVMGMIEWRQKSKPKKIPGPNINPPPKIPRVCNWLNFICRTTRQQSISIYLYQLGQAKLLTQINPGHALWMPYQS